MTMNLNGVGRDVSALFTSPDWGTIPDWLAAIGTISAVVVALRLAHRDAERLKEERCEAKEDRDEAAKERALFREQQEAEAEERKRRLAAKVTLVVKPFHEGAEKFIRWTVHNGGDEPISMVSVVRRPPPRNGSQEKPDVELSHTWPSIEAHGERTKVTQVYGALKMREGEVQFIDGAGQRWQRMEFGSLRMVGPDDPDRIGMVMLER
ncbi:hypothetical protein [Arthrobacter sp. W4I7]|uniref:hypothetical protein n=1 Tax=Arthrobacter sp. W4I7 TaxID=3042296 RepID=UPI0027896C4F|nr:hypothetical protein [Arthrobacter sp. W4I7]MDQ0691468.1 hypothetical protein [Arthrobacter sp. W4I7]